MGEPLTLDEVGVDPESAAQIIYDLRRQRNRYKDALNTIAACDCHAAETAKTALDGERSEL